MPGISGAANVKSRQANRQTSRAMWFVPTERRREMAETDNENRGQSRELDELRRELVETRNLIIKTDNLLKGVDFHVKAISKKTADQYKRTLVATGVAYAIFFAAALMIGVLVSRVAVNGEKRRVEAAEQQIAEAKKQADDAKAAMDAAKSEAARRQSLSLKAGEVFKQLTDARLEVRLKGLTASASLDMSGLSALEKAAIEEHVARLRVEAGDSALEKARTAFRRQDMRAAADLFAQYFAFKPTGKDVNQAHYMAGAAYFELKEFAKAAEHLEPFVASGKPQKNHEYATNMLGQALEKIGDKEKAFRAYDRGLNDYPGSASIRARQTALAKALGYKPAASMPAPAAPAAAPATPAAPAPAAPAAAPAPAPQPAPPAP